MPARLLPYVFTFRNFLPKSTLPGSTVQGKALFLASEAHKAHTATCSIAASCAKGLTGRACCCCNELQDHIPNPRTSVCHAYSAVPKLPMCFGSQSNLALPILGSPFDGSDGISASSKVKASDTLLSRSRVSLRRALQPGG